MEVHVALCAKKGLAGPTNACSRSGMTTEKVTEDLLRRARAGDAKAVHDVVQKIEPWCRVRIAKVLHGAPYASRADVDDILQETLLVFLKTEGGPADRWEPAKGSFENFAAGKAEHLALDLRRKRRKEGSWFDAEDCESAEPEVDSSRTPERQLASRQLLVESLKVCRAEQSPQGKEMLQMLIVDRLGVREVAQMMCMEPAAVYAWRSRLMRRLKEIAQRMGGVA
ncbi:MAG TPA: sigma-70 family RNA polymerase sigma factor [Polyangium sp.]|nr:sigma-70 family RNA polymerase sigma factor [Polyangium sp.]